MHWSIVCSLTNMLDTYDTIADPAHSRKNDTPLLCVIRQSVQRLDLLSMQQTNSCIITTSNASLTKTRFKSLLLSLIHLSSLMAQLSCRGVHFLSRMLKTMLSASPQCSFWRGRTSGLDISLRSTIHGRCQ